MTQATSKLAALRERVAGKTSHVEPKFTPSTDFTTKRWYDTIRATPTTEVIRSACNYYQEAFDDGKQFVVPVGNLETLSVQLPGISFYYRAILIDVQQARRWLEERVERLESELHNHYMYDDEPKAKYGALKTTEASKLAKADVRVVEMMDNVRLLAYHEHLLETLMSAFDNIKYVLNNIVIIRQEKLEEVWVDPTKETTNA